MKNYSLLLAGLLSFSTASLALENVTPKQIEEVHQRMKQVVPYALDETLQTFTNTVHGGVQHVVSKSPDNAKQIKLIQSYLLKITDEFRKSDFSVTERIYGTDMPGLAILKSAQLDDIKFEYKPLENGAQIHYATEDTLFIQALHAWFDAQIEEYGNDDIPGHNKHHSKIAE